MSWNKGNKHSQM